MKELNKPGHLEAFLFCLIILLLFFLNKSKERGYLKFCDVSFFFFDFNYNLQSIFFSIYYTSLLVKYCLMFFVLFFFSITCIILFRFFYSSSFFLLYICVAKRCLLFEYCLKAKLSFKEN